MENVELFSVALGFTEVHKIDKLDFKATGKSRELHIWVSFNKASKFEHEGKAYSTYDHQIRTWRHLDFFQHVCYIHCEVPRIKTEKGEYILVDVPWAKSYGRLTHQFEDYVGLLVKEGLNFTAVGRITGLEPKRIQRIIKSKVMAGLQEPLKDIKHLSIDETSSKKGHNYLTILADNEEKKVVGIGFGKDKNAVVQALEEVTIREADVSKVRTVTMDMSRSFISAATDYLPKADIIFDKFHIIVHLNKIVDTVRKAEAKNHSDLKNTKFIWLKNNHSLSVDLQREIQLLSDTFPTLGAVYALKESFKIAWQNSADEQKLKWINAWMKQATEYNIPLIDDFVIFLKKHWYGIKTYFKFLKDNAFAERVNLKIQEIKRNAKGFANMENFKFLIYFHLGKLNNLNPL